MKMESTPGIWDLVSERKGYHAVFSPRWPVEDCIRVHEKQSADIRKLLRATGDVRLLDVGCGVGRLTRALADTACTTVGIDYSDGMLEKAQAATDDPRLVYVRGSATAMPFPRDHFNHAIACFVLQHILDNDQFKAACAELVRVVRPGGMILTVDGIGVEESFPAGGDDFTVIRTLQNYVDALGESVNLISNRPVDYSGDSYHMMLWRNGVEQ